MPRSAFLDLDYLFSRLPYAWWVFPLLFFAPDVSLLGLFAGKRIGALTYNLVHHKAVAFGAYILGGLLGIPLLSLVGVLLLGHSGFDRFVGLGLMDAMERLMPLSSHSANELE